VKLQIDMCMCLAVNYGYDLTSEDARHLVFLLAVGGALERAGSPLGARVASQAGVRLLRQYLKGAALQTLKALFRRLGLVLTRKSLEKALPFGIGVAVGAGANYGLTRYVGKQANEWFELDRSAPPEGLEAKSPAPSGQRPPVRRLRRRKRRRSSKKWDRSPTCASRCRLRR